MFQDNRGDAGLAHEGLRESILQCDVPKGREVTYFDDDNCIRCKIMDCVEVCPVDCFYEGGRQCQFGNPSHRAFYFASMMGRN